MTAELFPSNCIIPDEFSGTSKLPMAMSLEVGGTLTVWSTSPSNENLTILPFASA